MRQLKNGDILVYVNEDVVIIGMIYNSGGELYICILHSKDSIYPAGASYELGVNELARWMFLENMSLEDIRNVKL